jgi:endo-1,4-beta-xylanase
MMRKILFILLLLMSVSFNRSEPLCEKVSLHEQASFPVGVAVNIDKLDSEEKYRNVVLSQFNSITAEKSMKAMYIHPKKNSYNFSDTDELIRFCQKHNKRLHGHTLVWYKRNPTWMENFKGDKEAWELMLKDHIQTIINHCKWYVKSWDVVNEAFTEEGQLRDNIWLKNIGESYIEKSFLYAAEADPSAKLFYNDYDLESNAVKLDAVLKYFTALRSKGVKIDGIGMQMHIGINNPYLSDINMAAMKVQSHGFLVHYSELDISLVKSGKLFSMSGHMLELQKERMKEIVEGYMKLDAQFRFGITVWGASDADTWLSEERKDRPLLFDTRYKVKPAYCGFLEGLKE